MCNVTDISGLLEKRRAAKPQNVIDLVGERAVKTRARKLLISWIEEHKDLGREYLLGELEGAEVYVRALSDT